uniref:ADP-ribosylhydrolase ARH3 n=1 Tax=Amphilophus citrinellus TaxID=61819 RepID=A0A3Q0TC59_AMPCI
MTTKRRLAAPPVLLAASAGQGCEARHEEVQPGKWDHVHGQFPQVGVELAREAQTGGHTAHCGRDKVVEVAVGGRSELQRAEADVIQGLIIDAVGLICVLYQLVDGEGGVVWLHHCVRHLENKRIHASPHRGYGAGVIQVLKKLSSPQLSDVYQPARDQFNGRGSFGNGGTMRAAPFALAFPDMADVKRVTLAPNTSMIFPSNNQHMCYRSLSYKLTQTQILLIKLGFCTQSLPEDHLKDAEKPFCERRVRDLMDRSKVSIEEVISELGDGLAALQSTPTTIVCVLHCLQPLPESYGGDTDTIACMAGAIAAAHYGIETIPQSWIRCCAGRRMQTRMQRFSMLYYQFPQGGRSETGDHRHDPPPAAQHLIPVWK